MVLLSLESALRDEHREVGVFDADALDKAVEEFGDLFPDEVGSRAQDVAS